jgi:hypothetical protein
MLSSFPLGIQSSKTLFSLRSALSLRILRILWPKVEKKNYEILVLSILNAFALRIFVMLPLRSLFLHYENCHGMPRKHLQISACGWIVAQKSG